MTNLLITLTGISLSLVAPLVGENFALAASPAAALVKSPLVQLQTKIEAAQAGWTAGESSVTRMNEKDWPALLGLQEDIAPDVQFDNHLNEAEESPSEFAVRTENTSTVDWRSRNGSNWVSPIMNQGKCGSCVAFSSIGTLETQLRIDSGYSGYNAKLSPQYLFSCGGASCSFGWTPSSAAQFLQKYGATDESCMPYASSDGSNTSCKTACADSASRRVRIADFSQPTSAEHNIAAIKLALKKGPLVTTMNVYQDFMYYQSGVYRHVSGKRTGSHAISIVGYDDNARALIMRNSWGPDWGESGFARISYDDTSGFGDNTWAFQVTPFKGVSMNSPADGSYANQKVSVQTRVTFSGSSSVRANVYNSNRQLVLSKVLATPVLSIATLANGRYEIEVQALDKKSNVLGTSQRHYFFVSSFSNLTARTLATRESDEQVPSAKNFSLGGSKLTLNLSHETSNLAAAVITRDANLKKHLRSFRVNANVGDGEVSRVTFHVRKVGAGETVQTAQHVRDGASLTWKTDGLNSGNYEYWISGEIDGNGSDTAAESAHQFLVI